MEGRYFEYLASRRALDDEINLVRDQVGMADDPASQLHNVATLRKLGDDVEAAAEHLEDEIDAGCEPESERGIVNDAMTLAGQCAAKADLIEFEDKHLGEHATPDETPWWVDV